LRNSQGECQLRVASGMVEGVFAPPVLAAFHRREGTFSFRPGPVPSELDWQPMEEFLVRLARLPWEASREAKDELSELRETLSEVAPVSATRRVLVVAGDPRPYRGLEVEWGKRGWELVVTGNPAWPTKESLDAVVVHLPGSATLAGQGDLWLAILRKAQEQVPPVPVVWVGGLADARLRHEAVQAGAAFLLPAPAGEVGEAARWFREDLTAVLERLLHRPATAGEGWAFREFFLALHAETTPEETRASLLRLAAHSFSRGLLVGVADEHLEVLGGFGFSPIPKRLPRGLEVLEEVIAKGVFLEGQSVSEGLGGLVVGGDGLWVFPLRRREGTVGLLLASGKQPDTDLRELAHVLQGAAALLGL
ncbi:MAG: hypothetical protein ACK42L_09350, partial [Thermoanaerobaculum sp.]